MITKKNIFNNDNLARSISWKTNRQNWAKGTIYKEIWRPLLTLLNNLFSKLFPPANFLLVTRKHQQHSLLQHFIGPSVNLWKKCILLQKARSFMKMDRLQICFFSSHFHLHYCRKDIRRCKWERDAQIRNNFTVSKNDAKSGSIICVL